MAARNPPFIFCLFITCCHSRPSPSDERKGINSIVIYEGEYIAVIYQMLSLQWSLVSRETEDEIGPQNDHTVRCRYIQVNWRLVQKKKRKKIYHKSMQFIHKFLLRFHILCIAFALSFPFGPMWTRKYKSKNHIHIPISSISTCIPSLIQAKG